MTGKHDFARVSTAFGLILFLILISIPTHAQLYDLKGIGTRSSAMGGAGIASARNGEAIYHNPALLALSDEWMFTLAGQVRSQYVQDTWGDDRTLADDTELAFHQVSTVLPLGEWGAAGFLAGRAMNPVLNDRTWSGAPLLLSPAIGLNLDDSFYLGAAANIWRGSVSRPDQQVAGGRTADVTVDYEGWNATVGFAIPFDVINHDHHFLVSAMYRTGLTLESDDTQIFTLFGETQYITQGGGSYPVGNALGLGLEWEGFDRVTVAVDYEMRDGQKEDVVDIPEATGSVSWLLDRYTSDNSRQLRVGAEVLIPIRGADLYLRAGQRFHWLPMAAAEADNVFARTVSAGFGITNGVAGFDLAYEIESCDQTVEYVDGYELETVHKHIEYTFSTVWLSMTIAISEYF